MYIISISLLDTTFGSGGLLVPPAHEKTTDQAQFEPATVQTTPLVLAKIFIEFWSFCSKFELF